MKGILFGEYASKLLLLPSLPSLPARDEFGLKVFGDGRSCHDSASAVTAWILLVFLLHTFLKFRFRLSLLA